MESLSIERAGVWLCEKFFDFGILFQEVIFIMIVFQLFF